MYLSVDDTAKETGSIKKNRMQVAKLANPKM